MTRRARLLVSSVTASVLGFATVAVGQTTQTNMAATLPASATAPAISEGSLTVVVTAVQGGAEVRAAEDQPWQPAKVGMQVGEQAEFRTGPRGKVQFQIPPDQTITVDRVTAVKVLTAVKQSGVVRTNIGMKYGRTRYSIEAAGVEHEATISSPSSTLAVRGTDFMQYDQRPFAFEATSFTGRVEVRDAKKRVIVGSRGGTQAKVDANAESAAQYAAQRTYVDPGQRLARSTAEQPLIAALISHGATVNFDMEKGIKVISGGRPLTDRELIPTLPGTLNFVLRWTGNADLNLGVHAPAPNSFTSGATIYPIGSLSHAPSGGQTAFDHRGGPNGGMEICFWPGTVPLGEYQIGVQHISGVVTPAQVDVFRDGKRIPITRLEQEFQTVNFIAGPTNPQIAEGIAVGSVRILDPSAQGAKAAKSAKTLISPLRVAGPPTPASIAKNSGRKSKR